MSDEAEVLWDVIEDCSNGLMAHAECDPPVIVHIRAALAAVAAAAEAKVAALEKELSEARAAFDAVMHPPGIPGKMRETFIALRKELAAERKQREELDTRLGDVAAWLSKLLTSGDYARPIYGARELLERVNSTRAALSSAPQRTAAGAAKEEAHEVGCCPVCDLRPPSADPRWACGMCATQNIPNYLDHCDSCRAPRPAPAAPDPPKEEQCKPQS